MTTNDEWLTVHIVGMPLDLQQRSQQHSDELIRELTLISEAMRQDGTTGELPVCLVELVDQLTRTYSGFTDEQENKVADAIAAGAKTLDLTYRLPASIVGATEVLGDTFDEADKYCRAGQHLLTLATPPEQVAYRRWILGEFARQGAGQPPRSWADYRAAQTN